MNQPTDSANTGVRPPIAWALAFVAGLVADWLIPLRLLPAFIAGVWLGSTIVAAGLAIAIWAIVMIRKAGSAGSEPQAFATKGRRQGTAPQQPAASLFAGGCIYAQVGEMFSDIGKMSTRTTEDATVQFGILAQHCLCKNLLLP